MISRATGDGRPRWTGFRHWPAPRLRVFGSIATRRTRDAGERGFFDTNVLGCSVTAGDRRQDIAIRLLAEGGVVSVQVLNEFAAVARRKLGFTWPDVVAALREIRTRCSAPRPLTTATHDAALALAERYGFTIDDALIAAAALDAGCTTLLSEDLSHGQAINTRLTVRNPFAAG